jgi:hypothetical protein
MAHFSDLVLEKLSQWLHELKLQILRQAANVVMALDGAAVLLPRARRGTRLDDIRV